MKSLIEFINEAKTEVPLDGICDSTGREMCHLPYLSDADYLTMPRYEFTFRNVSEKKDFCDTTASCEFWDAIYDYNSIAPYPGREPNNWAEIDNNMHKFGNVIVGKKLYIYCYDAKFADELKERGDKASHQFNFSGAKYIG